MSSPCRRSGTFGAPASWALAATWLALALAVSVAWAGSDALRTLIVRGRVLKADGTPIAGARVAARGSFTVSALTDDGGRYTLTVPMGAPAGLRHGAFSLEVRAEIDGRKLPFAAGGPALGIAAELAAGTTRLHVRSNAPGATSAVIGAFTADDAATATVDADFGGAAPGGGALELKAADEATLTGIAPAPGNVHSEKPVTAKPAAPVVHAGSEPAAARPAAAFAHSRDSLMAIARVETRDSTLARTARRHAADSLAKAQARARRESGARAKAAQRRADSLAIASRLVVRRAPAPERADPELAAAGDSCRCRIRGTIEVAWERPLEENLPVTVTLEGTDQPEQGIELYLGAPREFRFGPLPCGLYHLRTHVEGRYRYVLQNGDSLYTVRCRDNTQVRLVLSPLKR